MTRRDFLWRMAIAAAFACAGWPLVGDALRKWAVRKQRHDAILRQLRYQSQQAMERISQKLAEQIYGSYPASAFDTQRYVSMHPVSLVSMRRYAVMSVRPRC